MEAADCESVDRISQLLHLGVSTQTLDTDGASVFSYIDKSDNDLFKRNAREALTKNIQNKISHKEPVQVPAPEKLVQVVQPTPQKEGRFERLTDVHTFGARWWRIVDGV